MSTLTYARPTFVRIPSVEVIVTQPNGERISIPLDLTPLTVGTDPDRDISISDPHVSGHHCSLKMTEDGILLGDPQSKNGTFVGELRVRAAILPPDVPVKLGSSILIICQVGEPSIIELSQNTQFGRVYGMSVPMRRLFAALERAAPSDATVLLLGESGTGKELLARSIHDASPRAGGPYEIFDCTAVAPTLIEAELFGHSRGSFTGATSARAGIIEKANGGTLFIDEIGDLPLHLQPKLLRLLESRQIRRLGSSDLITLNIRIVAATNKDLKRHVKLGAFRSDLYFRLAVAVMKIPPLRERKEDIALLIEHLLTILSPGATMASLPRNTVELLSAYDWPGNVRELRNTVERLLLFGQSALKDLTGPLSSETSAAWEQMTLHDARASANEQFEVDHVQKVFSRCGGNVGRAATAMRVSRQYAHKLRDKYEVMSDDG